MHTPCRLRNTLTTNRQVPKWFHSHGRCAHRVINFCGAPLSNKPPRLLPLSLVILLGDSTTPFAVLHRASPDIIKPACHRPTCRYSIIKQTCLGCCRLISRYVLRKLIVLSVAMVVVVKADCQSFAAVDIVVSAAAVIPPHYHRGGDDNNRHHCRCKGGRVKGHPPTLLQEREKRGVYSLPTAAVGGMMPTLVAATAREVAERGIL